MQKQTMASSMITIALVLMTALTAHAANLRSNEAAALPNQPSGSGIQGTPAALGAEEETTEEEPTMPPRQPGDTRGPWSHTGHPVLPDEPKEFVYNPYADTQPAERTDNASTRWNTKWCLDGWTHYNVTDHCYKKMAAASFSAASLDCSKQAVMCVNCPWAHIAIPNNPTEGAWLYTTMGNGSSALWVGYNFGGYNYSKKPTDKWAFDSGEKPPLNTTATGGPFFGKTAPSASVPLIKLHSSTGEMTGVPDSGTNAYVCESNGR